MQSVTNAASTVLEAPSIDLQIMEIVVQGVGSVGTICTVLFAIYVYSQDRKAEQFSKIREAYSRIPANLTAIDTLLDAPDLYASAEIVVDGFLAAFPSVASCDDLFKCLDSKGGKSGVLRAIMLAQAKSGVGTKAAANRDALIENIVAASNKFPTITEYLRALAALVDQPVRQCFGGDIFSRVLTEENYRKDIRKITNDALSSGGTWRSALTEALAIGPISSLLANGQEGFDLAEKMMSLVVEFMVKQTDASLSRISAWDREFYVQRDMANVDEIAQAIRIATEGLRKFLPPATYTELVESRTLIEKLMRESPDPRE